MLKNYKALRAIMIVLFFIILAPLATQAQWGQALHYKWWNHDRVIVPQAADYWPFVVNQGTVEMWFKPDSVLKADTHDPDYTYLFCKNISGNNEGDMGISWGRGKGELQNFIQDGAATTSVYPSITVWEPRWYHVAFVWDVDDSMRVFIDGIQHEAVAPCPPVHGGTQAIVIGSGAVNLLDARYETFRGTIDEVRVSMNVRYTEDFSPQSAPYQPDAYTLALWHFDDGTGLVATDATGNGFDGILGDTLVAGNNAPDWVEVERDMLITINEFLADPSTDDAGTPEIEGDSNGDGIRDAAQDEFVELLNVSGRDIDLTGWQVGDDEDISFTFPDGYIIKPYEFVTIFGGGDVSNVPGYDADSLKTRAFISDSVGVGNGLANGGDYIVILSPDGSHDMYLGYNSKYGAGDPTADEELTEVNWIFRVETATPAAENNSLTLNPDGVMEGDDWYYETLVVTDSTAAFTPNMTVDGKEAIEFALNVTIEGSGEAIQDTTMDSYPIGTTVNLEAVPADGWVFDGWYLDGEKGFGNPYGVLINNNVDLTVKFVEQFQVTPKLIFNEILPDVAGDVINGDANADSVRDGSGDEFVELVNISDEPFDLTGFKLGDDEDLSFTFPDGYIVQPKNFVVVFGGGDVSNVPGYDADPLQTRVFISDSVGVGNGLANGGDFVLLISPDGAYDMYMSYEGKYNIAGPTSGVVEGIDFELRCETDVDASDPSITRNPDGDISVGNPFVHMTSIIDTVYWTPGQTVDGKDDLVVSVDEENSQLPNEFNLYNNYPNPFNPSTVIKVALPSAQHVALRVYNIHGELVSTLVNNNLSAGYHQFTWNGTNNNGSRVSSGIYFYQVISNEFNQVKKMMLVK
ncbi:MAG: lamin tail domain-containing protein [Bacteroidota bacterium]